MEDTTATNYRQVMQADVSNTLSPQIRVRNDQDHKKVLGCIWFLGDELGIFVAFGFRRGGFDIWHGRFGIMDCVLYLGSVVMHDNVKNSCRN